METPSTLFDISLLRFFAIIIGVVTHVFSLGSIEVRSSYSDTHPDIDPNYLSLPLEKQCSLTLHFAFDGRHDGASRVAIQEQ